MSPRVLPLSFSLGLCLAALVLLPACSGGPACVIDTDCPLGNRCAPDQTCQPVGAGVDAGARPDAGGRDAAVADAGSDGGGEIDAGGDDAGPACATLTAGTFVVQEPFVGSCVFTSAAQVTVAAGAAACEWTATSVADPVVDGSFTVDAAGALTASLRIAGAADPVECTGTFTEADGNVAFTCPPDCVITLVPMPAP